MFSSMELVAFQLQKNQVLNLRVLLHRILVGKLDAKAHPAGLANENSIKRISLDYLAITHLNKANSLLRQQKALLVVYRKNWLM